MFRLYYHIFWYEDPDYGEHKPHDAHWTMTVPLIVLAAYTCICGFFPFGHLVTASHTFIEIHTEPLIAGISICTAILGIAIATILYRKKNSIPDAIIAKSKLFCNAAYHRFYIDECWYFITRRIIFGILCAFIAWFDRHIIDGFMNLLGWITNKSSLETREIQSGNVQEYVWVFIMGVITIAALALYL
jgi:NADH-quinone oxidoreductase subunit L